MRSEKFLLLVVVLALGQSVGAQEACCPGVGAMAIGFGLHGNTPLLIGRFWLSSRSAFEVGLAEPFQFTWFSVASLQVLRPFCTFRPYVAAGANLPMRYEHWWITGWAGVGVEWCPPGLENLAFGFTGGMAFT
ncbi:MAG: hypothetical protein NZ651_06990, partial [Candidatus Bipolaricaulota bacterium]|nr:hypothetical protein [Candidatus Bipolaricaulota bacterium]MDW8127498.1 hypothetical protein [Candidatus Bipolaricaulota bacterium]